MSDIIDFTHALKFSIGFSLKTPLLLRSGFEGDFTDSTIEKTPDKMQLYINGYVWASLLRRSMARLIPYKKISSEIGKFEQPEKQGVSAFWFESSFVPLIALDARPGIKIDRKYGTTIRGALYNDEIVPPGHKITLNFICFHDGSNTEELINAVGAAFWVVNEGIENIGGGWSYGYGRLNVENIFARRLDLSDDNQRVELWKDITDYDKKNPIDIIKPKKGDICKHWEKYTVTAKVMKGQLLAVHSNHIPNFSETLPQEIQALDHLPDTFVFRRYKVGENDMVEPEFSIPGKAIRQALFSVPIERKLRTNKPDTICSTPGEYCTCETCNDYRKGHSKGNSPKCDCQRCKWFGSTENGGIVAVTDGIFNMDGSNKPETVIISRVQLCEHSMQNINLFSGEYLKQGVFKFDIWIDYSISEPDANKLKNEIELLLGEMKKDSNAPTGWHRLGATSTCTGQVVIDF